MNNIKKFLSLLFVTVFALVLIGCTNEGNSDLDKLNEQADKIYLGSLEEVTKDIMLPKYAFGDKDFTVTWASSDSAVIEVKELESEDAELYYLGSVNMALEVKKVTLTATVKYNNLTVKREFVATVLADEYVGYNSIAEAKAVADKTKDVSKIKFNGTVSFVTGSGFGVTDNTGSFYCYGSNHGRTVGEQVTVRGVWTYYNNMVQLKEAVAKVNGTDKDFNIANIAETGKSIADVAAIATKDVDPENVTRIFKVKFAAKENASGAYNTYKLVDPLDSSKCVDVTKYNDADTLTEVGKMVGDKFYEGIIILYCSRSGTNGLWDVLYVPGSAVETQITLTDEQKVANVITELTDSLNGKTIKANVNLLTSHSNGATITWASDKPEVISETGVYVAPNAKTEVKLTATITLNNVTETVELTVVAKSKVKTEAAVVTEPQVGVTYKFGMDQKGVNKLLFITGTMSGFYGASTEDHSDSVDVQLEAAEGGYYIVATIDGAKKYITAEVSGTYLNFKYLDQPNVVWTYNSEYNTMVANVDGTELFLGGNGTYETFGAYAIAKLSTNYPAHFYVEKEILPYTINPEVGVDYKLGMEQTAVDKVLYITGVMSGYYGATTENQAEAVNVQLEAAEGGYYITTTIDGAKKYVSAVVSGTYINFKYLDEANVVWTFNTEYNTLVATIDGKEVFLGGNGTYETFGGYDISKIATNYPAKLFYADDSSSETPENPDKPNIPDTPTEKEASIAELLAIGAALADQAKSEDSYIVKGTVTEVTTAYDPSYKNVTFIITDGTNTLECFRAKGNEAANVVAGDKVELYGQMQKYGEKVQLVYAEIRLRVAETGSNPSESSSIVLDFAGKFADYAAEWEMSYGAHTLTNTDLGVDTELTVDITRANKQTEGNAIDDRHVIAAKSSTEYVTIEVKSGAISSIEFDLNQWTTKTFESISIEYFDGTNWVKCSDVITTPAKLQSSELAGNVTKVRLAITTSETKNIQVGLAAATIVLK